LLFLVTPGLTRGPAAFSFKDQRQYRGCEQKSGIPAQGRDDE